ncbi:unnamed protein product [Polarella glacialis]|uniref:Uncharacterized protein n=1 Tax=Polarella glacialis TaxID=89957 RepID=A0A813G5E1_POLGL|nr:unnamed protein product [Polarella glacialis]
MPQVAGRRFLNSGIILGRVSALREMLSQPVPNIMPGSDQAWYQAYGRKYPDKVLLDTSCELLCALNGAPEKNGMQLSSGRMVLSETGASPLVLHCVGRGRPSSELHEIFSALYPVQAGRLLDPWTADIVLGPVQTVRLYSGQGFWTSMLTVLCIQCGLLGSGHHVCRDVPSPLSAGCALATLTTFLVALVLCAGVFRLSGRKLGYNRVQDDIHKVS